MSGNDVEFLVVILGWMLLLFATVGTFFLVDMLAWALFNRSFIGWIDKYVLRG